MNKLLLIILVFLFFGCDHPAKYETEINSKKVINACLAQGGIPIQSEWTGLLKDCKFRDEQVKILKVDCVGYLRTDDCKKGEVKE